MTRLPVSLLCVLVVCLPAAPARAQDAEVIDPPAHISVVEGSAQLERDGRADGDLTSMPILAGDRLRTQGGRLEVLFGDGSALHLDANTVVDFQSDEVVRLLEGRVRLNVAGPRRELAYRIDAPSAWVQIGVPGEYRISVLRSDEVELAVLRGSAELVNEQGRSYISAGERTFARAGTAPSPAYVFNSASWDAFDRWSESRRDLRLGASTQYLPEDVRGYAPAFDNYGSWRYEQVYGHVWYPRVQVGWRPYYRGRWVSLRPYGWTWIAGDPWGWPTHHYGRWGYSSAGWFWIPGRTWGPAWVSWAHAPGYVGWCPLGWNNRPIFALNVHGRHRYDPWVAWSAVPRHHFNAGYVNVAHFRSVRVADSYRGQFVVNHRGPAGQFAVNRSAIPIRTAGRPAGARSAEGARALPDRATGIAVDRGFPASARTPGTTLHAQTERSLAPGVNGRTRAAQPPAGYPATPIPDATGRSRAVASGSPAAAYQRENGAARSQAYQGPPAVATPAPTGAVRAVPRSSSAQIPDAYRRQDRVRTQPSPSAEAPTGPPPSYAPPVSRSSPVDRGLDRSAGAPAGMERSYGRSRAEAPGGASAPSREPTARPAPERQAPPSTDRGARSEAPGPERAGSGGRERSSESRSTGQATGRRR